MGTNMDEDKGKAEQAVAEITGEEELKDRGVEDSATDLAEKVKDTMEDATDQSEELLKNATDAAQRT